MKLGKTLNKVMQAATIGDNGTTTKKPIGGAKTFSAPEINAATNKAAVAKSDEDLEVNKLVGTRSPTGAEYDVKMAKEKIAYDKAQKAKKSVQ